MQALATMLRRELQHELVICRCCRLGSQTPALMPQQPVTRLCAQRPRQASGLSWRRFWLIVVLILLFVRIRTLSPVRFTSAASKPKAS